MYTTEHELVTSCTNNTQHSDFEGLAVLLQNHMTVSLNTVHTNVPTHVRINLVSLLFSSPTVSTSTSASSNSFSTSNQVCNPLPRPLTGFTTTYSLRGRAPNSAHVNHRDTHKCLRRQTYITTKHSFSTCAHI